MTLVKEPSHLPPSCRANQAFVNVVLALVDPEDSVAVIAPIYFDHIMTLYVPSCKLLASTMLQLLCNSQGADDQAC
jgi:aspartate/methionine/tyrosine aminotransferase